MKNRNCSKLTFVILLAVIFSIPQYSEAKLLKFKQASIDKGSNSTDDLYYEIESINVKPINESDVQDETDYSLIVHKNPEKIRPPSPNIPPIPPELVPKFSMTGAIMIVDGLIAIGQKLVPVIKAGQAVVTNNPMAAVSVLPKINSTAPELNEMENWSVPLSKHYKITFNNGLGMEVISFVYSITFQANGSFNGKGKYLTGVRAQAKNISVAWGFDLSATSQLIQVSNVGTKENPVAGATLEMSYSVGNWTRTISTTESFHVTGDGRLYKLD